MRCKPDRWLALILVAILLPAPAAGQDTEQQSSQSAAQPPRVVQLPATTTWKFGIRMTGTGATQNAKVTLPVPVDWPEQKIEVISIDTTDNVTGAKIRSLPGNKEASQLFFKVPRLANGEQAEAFVTFRVSKLESNAPERTAGFVFAKKISRRLRGFLTPSPYIESKDDRIIEIAETLPIDESMSAWEQVETIYTWVRENIEYEFDPTIRSCLTALDAGKGDCEELSSLFIALCRARGIPARAVWIPEHTYPEFYLEDAEGKGHWFPCQCAGSYAFGHMPEAKPILQKGDKFKVRNHPKPLRYIQPTMTAFGATPGWTWEMKQVENDNSGKSSR